MKVVLFCGGLGMRLRDYSETIPKPMWTDESFISGEKAAEKTLTVGASSR